MKISFTITADENPLVVRRLISDGDPDAILEYVLQLVAGGEHGTPFDLKLATKITIKVDPGQRSLFAPDREAVPA